MQNTILQGYISNNQLYANYSYEWIIEKIMLSYDLFDSQ